MRPAGSTAGVLAAIVAAAALGAGCSGANGPDEPAPAAAGGTVADGTGAVTGASTSGEANKGPPARIRRCATAISEAPVPPGEEPRFFKATRVGSIAFNDLEPTASRRNALDPPTKRIAYYRSKTPLTVWPQPATLTVGAPGDGARLIYDDALFARLARGELPWSALPRSTRFGVCRSGDGDALATQYNGGIAALRPTCIRLSVREKGKVSHETVRFGVRRCPG